jgi:hypothetical protein
VKLLHGLRGHRELALARLRHRENARVSAILCASGGNSTSVFSRIHARSEESDRGDQGRRETDIKPGDVIVIPPETAHWFSKINGHVTYIEARFPGNVLAPAR